MTPIVRKVAPKVKNCGVLLVVLLSPAAEAFWTTALEAGVVSNVHSFYIFVAISRMCLKGKSLSNNGFFQGFNLSQTLEGPF